MSAIVKAIIVAVINAVASYFVARKRDADIQALGRAEAERDAAMAAAERAEDIGRVPHPDDDETIRRLREGSA